MISTQARVYDRLRSVKSKERQAALAEVARSLPESDIRHFVGGSARLLAHVASSINNDKAPPSYANEALQRSAKLCRNASPNPTDARAAVESLSALLTRSAKDSKLESAIVQALDHICFHAGGCGDAMSACVGELSDRLLHKPAERVQQLAPALASLCKSLIDAGAQPDCLADASEAVRASLCELDPEEPAGLREAMTAAEAILLHRGLDIPDPLPLAGCVVSAVASSWKSVRTMRPVMANASRAALHLCGKSIDLGSLIKLWRAVDSAASSAVVSSSSSFDSRRRADDATCRERALLSDLLVLFDKQIYNSSNSDDTPEEESRRKRQRMRIPELHELCGADDASHSRDDVAARLLWHNSSAPSATVAGAWLQQVSKRASAGIWGLAVMALAAISPRGVDPPDGESSWRRAWAHATTKSTHVDENDARGRLAACLACNRSADCGWPGTATFLDAVSKCGGDDDDPTRAGDDAGGADARAAACALVIISNGGPRMQRSEKEMLVKASLLSTHIRPSVGGNVCKAAFSQQPLAELEVRAFCDVRCHALPSNLQHSAELEGVDEKLDQLHKSACLYDPIALPLDQSEHCAFTSPHCAHNGVDDESECLASICLQSEESSIVVRSLASASSVLTASGHNENLLMESEEENEQSFKEMLCKRAARTIVSAAETRTLRKLGSAAIEASTAIARCMKIRNWLWMQENLCSPLLRVLCDVADPNEQQHDFPHEEFAKSEQEQQSHLPAVGAMDIDDLTADFDFTSGLSTGASSGDGCHGRGERQMGNTDLSSGDSLPPASERRHEHAALLACIGAFGGDVLGVDEIKRWIDLCDLTLYELAESGVLASSDDFLSECESVATSPDCKSSRKLLIRTVRKAIANNPDKSARTLELIASANYTHSGDAVDQDEVKDDADDAHNCLCWSAVEREELCVAVTEIAGENFEALMSHQELLFVCEQSLSQPWRNARIAAARALASTMAQSDPNVHSGPYSQIVNGLPSDDYGPGMEVRCCALVFAAMASSHAEPMAVGRLLRDAGKTFSGRALRAEFIELCIERLARFFRYDCIDTYLHAIASYVTYGAGDEGSGVSFAPQTPLRAHVAADGLALNGRIRKAHSGKQVDARACARVLLNEGTLPEHIGEKEARLSIGEAMLELVWGWDHRDGGPCVPVESNMHTPSTVATQIASLFDNNSSAVDAQMLIRLASRVGERAERCRSVRHMASCAGALRTMSKWIVHVRMQPRHSAIFCAFATRILCSMAQQIGTKLEYELHAIALALEELANTQKLLEQTETTQQQARGQNVFYGTAVLSECALEAAPVLLPSIWVCSDSQLRMPKLRSAAARALRALCFENERDLTRMEPLGDDGNEGAVESQRSAAVDEMRVNRRVQALCYRLTECALGCRDAVSKELLSKLPDCNRSSVRAGAMHIAAGARRDQQLVDVAAAVLRHAYGSTAEGNDDMRDDANDDENEDKSDAIVDDEKAPFRRLMREVEGKCLVGARGAKAAYAAAYAVPELRKIRNIEAEFSPGAQAMYEAEHVSPLTAPSATSSSFAAEKQPHKRAAVTNSSDSNEEGYGGEERRAVHDVSALAEDSLWHVSSESKDSWLKRLGAALAKAAGGYELLACVDVVAASAEAAQHAAELALERLAFKFDATSKVYEQLSDGVRKILLSAPIEHTRVMLDLLEKLRRRRLRARWKTCTGLDRQTGQWQYEAWVHVSSEDVARAALRCGEVNLASLWAEIHCGEGELLKEWGASLGAVETQLEAESQRERGGDPDRVLALARSSPANVRAQAQSAARIGMWTEAAAASDLLHRVSGSQPQCFKQGQLDGRNEMARALKRMGCSKAAQCVAQEERNAAAFSMGHWNAFQSELSVAIDAVADRECRAALESIGRAKSSVIAAIGEGNATPRIRLDGLDRLEALAALERCDRFADGAESGEVALQTRIDLAHAFNDETLIAQELRRSAHIERNEAPGRSLEMLRMARMLSGANSAASSATVPLNAWLDEAKALRLIGQRDAAAALLEESISGIGGSAGNTVDSSDCAAHAPDDGERSERTKDVRARCLCVAGKWAGRKREAEDHLNAAEAIAKGEREKGRASFRLGAHLEERWRAAEAFLREEESGEARNIHKRTREELKQVRSNRSSTANNPRQQRAARLRHKEIDEEDKEREATLNDAADALSRSLDAYRRCLRAGCGSYDTRGVYRLLALYLRISEQMPKAWDEALHGARKVGAQALLHEEHGGVPVGKLLPLLPQLASRLSRVENEDRSSVSAVACSACVRLAAFFPKATLPHLYGLVRASASQKQKQTAAKVWKKEVLSGNCGDESLSTANALSKVMEGYEALASDSSQSGEINSQHLPVAGRRRLEAAYPSAPVLTAHGSDLPGIYAFQPKYSIAGGQSKPKVISCIGTDGKAYVQILKQSQGEDLRQDKVMQQFCGLASDLLRSSGERRTMTMRTYAVAPIKGGCGVVECVEGTKALSEYLAKDKVGAHERLRPQDWKPKTCWEYLQQPPRSDKDAAFAKIRQQMKPVMRWFFFEHFPDASRWRAAKDVHAQSAAVSCMVGFFLGLGDRHASNVLVDAKSGEVVHIDFGIAFDQGRLLPTPERVPFRFTRDVRDGMGPESPHGPFRRACEASVSSLQKHKHALLTVVEVLVHDPLLDWTLTPEQAARRQQNSAADDGSKQNKHERAAADEQANEEHKHKGEDERNAEAEKAVLNVRRKLEGHVDGEVMLPEDQVQRLLEQASDVKRLGRMFPGWCAACHWFPSFDFSKGLKLVSV